MKKLARQSLHKMVSQRSVRGTLAVMPPPEVYDEEYRYWPWGQLINWASGWAESNLPREALVYDYMCGTGYLLALLQQARPDIRLSGCDIEASYVDYAARKYSGIAIDCADARYVDLTDTPNVILCTAGLHHLTYDEHDVFLDKMADECAHNGLVLIGEEVIDEYHDEKTRRLAALRLSNSLIEYGIKHEWPNEQVEAALDVLKNDVYLRGEYKRSAKEWAHLLQQRFVILETEWIWRATGSAGDLVFVCQRR